jgi:hypothetical protein
MKNKKLKRDCLCTATSHTSSPKSLWTAFQFLLAEAQSISSKINYIL